MTTHTSINNFLNLIEQNINIDQLIEDFIQFVKTVREIRKLVKECDSATFNGVQVTKNNINIEDNILFIYYYSDVYDSLIKVSTPLNEISKLQNNYYQLKSGTIKFHKMIDIKCENDTVSVV